MREFQEILIWFLLENPDASKEEIEEKLNKLQVDEHG
jgi:hypothetical protein